MNLEDLGDEPDELTARYLAAMPAPWPQRMTEAEVHAHSWWCPRCQKDVPPEMVTKDGDHYLEFGGCGYPLRADD